MRHRPILVHDPFDRAKSAWSIIRTSLSKGDFRLLETSRNDQIELHCINQTIALPRFASGPFQPGMSAEDLLTIAADALDRATTETDPALDMAMRASSYLLTFVEDLPDATHGLAVSYTPIGLNGLPRIGVWDGPNGKWRDVEVPGEALVTAAESFPVVATPERLLPIGWHLRLHDSDVHCSVMPMDALEVMRVTAGRR